MKNLRFSTRFLMGAAIACALSLSFVSCSDDDDDDDQPTPTTAGNGFSFQNKNNDSLTFVSDDIATNTTWTKNTIYILQDRIIVRNGATLTIEAGTIIKGEPGEEANAKPLVVARGSKIMANGTAAEPIIFTTRYDDIAIGEKVGSNLNETHRGLWAGIIILGYAPISPKSGSQANIEGIPISLPEGSYGGNDAADNSGTISYVSIRHGGVELVPGGGNEINGLTLGGVGSGTTINHIEVVANLDDGIEWFGGTVNVSNALVGFQGDDGFDIDQAYAGTISNIAYIGGTDSDHALEIDGSEGPQNSNGAFTITGGALTAANGEYADFRSNAKGNVNNLYFFGFESGADVELDNDGVSLNYSNGDLIMSGCVFNATTGVMITDVSDDKSDNPAIGFDFDLVFSTTNNNAIGTSAPSFDKSQFTGWTFADNEGHLNNF